MLGKKLGQYAYHEIARYNPVHKVIVFGGGNDSKGFVSREMWKLNADGKVTKLHEAPISIGITHTIFVVDPVTGQYLVFARDGSVYEYDVVADDWKKQPGEKKPPIFTFGADLSAGPARGSLRG